MKKIILIGKGTNNRHYNSLADAARFLGISYEDAILAKGCCNKPVLAQNGYQYFIDDLLEDEENERSESCRTK